MAKYLDQLLADLKLAVEKLHRFGFERVHLVTDHGFVLVANGNTFGKLPIQQAALRGDRYAFLAEGAVKAVGTTDEVERSPELRDLYFGTGGAK